MTKGVILGDRNAKSCGVESATLQVSKLQLSVRRHTTLTVTRNLVSQIALFAAIRHSTRDPTNKTQAALLIWRSLMPLVIVSYSGF